MRKEKNRQDKKNDFLCNDGNIRRCDNVLFHKYSDNIFRHSCRFSQFCFAMNEMCFLVESCSIKIRFKRRRAHFDYNQTSIVAIGKRNALPQRQQCDKKADSYIHD